MSMERTRAAIRLLYDEVVNKGNLDVMDEVFTSDVEMSTSAIVEGPEPEYGIERLKPALVKMREAFPGLRATIEDHFDGGDRVVARVHFYGHLPEEPNTNDGKHLLWTSGEVFRIYDGKVAEQFGSQDNVDLLRKAELAPLEVTKPLSNTAPTRRRIDPFSRENNP